MRKLYFLLFFIVIELAYVPLEAQCLQGRYYDAVFSANTTTTVQYGNAVQYNGRDTNLMVDVYQPKGDNLAHRPLMIFAFGGSFTSGARISPDLVILCTYFSQRGYVCASIDYRLGTPDGSDSSLFAALIRGVQDMKGAVRYFYKDAQTVDQFHIDTNNIFIGGVSAGAFIALNYAYLKTDVFSKPPPSFAIPVIVSLGGLDGSSGNLGYSQKVKGVIDLSGAIADTGWITDSDPIIVGEHGTMDSTVACYYDSLYALQNSRSSLFGGGDIKNRLSHIHLNNSFYLFYGAGHCPFIIPFNTSLQAIAKVPSYMDTTEQLIRDFVSQNVTCDPTVLGIDEIGADVSISVFPNPSDNEVGVYSHYGKDMDISVMGVDGRSVQRQVFSAYGILTLRKDELGSGIYLVQFADKVTGAILKTEKIVFQ